MLFFFGLLICSSELRTSHEPYMLITSYFLCRTLPHSFFINDNSKVVTIVIVFTIMNS